MPTVTLTAATARTVKPPAAGQVDHFHSRLSGFGLRVSPKARSYFVMYRPARGERAGRLCRLTIGPACTCPGKVCNCKGWPLGQALDQARKLFDAVREGRDPGLEKQAERAEREKPPPVPDTVSVVAERFIQQHVSRLRSATTTTALIRNHVLPLWGDKLMADITRRDVLALRDALAAKGMRQGGNRVLAVVKRMMVWAVDRDLLDANPAASVRGDIRENKRDRVLSDRELVLVWRAAESMGTGAGDFVRLAILLGQRRSEIAKLKRDQLDLTERMWTIPGERRKKGWANQVPLSDAALAIIEAQPRWAGRDSGDYVFSTTRGKKPIANFDDIKKALDAVVTELNGGEPIPHWILHDLRRGLRTGLSRMRMQKHIAKLALGQRVDGLDEVYDSHAYGPEVRGALRGWSIWVQCLVKFGAESWWPSWTHDLFDDRSINSFGDIVKALETLLAAGGPQTAEVVPMTPRPRK